MKHIYFLTSELAGDRAGSFRQERWINIFLSRNINVTVVNVISSISIETLQFTSVGELKKYRANILKNCKARSGVRHQGLVVKFLRLLKHFFLLDFFYPSIYCSYKKLVSLGATDKECTIFVSSPPFSLSIIPYILKKKNSKLKYIIDMRDAWALHHSIGGITYLKQKIEQKVLQDASSTITVSKWLSKEFDGTYNIETKVAYNVPTHYLNESSVRKIEDLDWNRISPLIDKSRLKIVYTGSTPVGHFDLTTFVEGVNILIQKKPNDIQFIFVGQCLNLKKLVDTKPLLQKHFIFVNQLPNMTVRTIQNNADALLFLGYDADGNAGVVSTKLYEYLILKKPILPIGVRENSDIAILLKKYTGQSISLLCPNKISNYISEPSPLISITQNMPKLITDKDFFIQSLYKDYEEALNSIIKL